MLSLHTSPIEGWLVICGVYVNSSIMDEMIVVKKSPLQD